MYMSVCTPNAPDLRWFQLHIKMYIYTYLGQVVQSCSIFFSFVFLSPLFFCQSLVRLGWGLGRLNSVGWALVEIHPRMQSFSHLIFQILPGLWLITVVLDVNVISEISVLFKLLAGR